MCHAFGLALVAWLALTAEPAVVAGSTSGSTFGAIPIQRLVDGARVVQHFDMLENNLTRIDLMFEQDKRKPRTPVIVSIRRPGETENIRRVALPADTLPERGRAVAVFPAIERSANQEYAVVVEQPGADRKSAVSVLGVDGDYYRDGRLVEPGSSQSSDVAGSKTWEPTQPMQDLVMSVYYLPPPGTFSKIEVLRERISLFKPRWLQFQALATFTVVGVALYTALLASFLISVTRGTTTRQAVLVHGASLAAGILMPLAYLKLF